MKKVLVGVMTLLIVVLAIFQSCKKEEGFSLSPNSETNGYDLKSQQDSVIQARIIAFMNRMKLVREDPDYEGSENWNYSEDSTIWYIEAALNMYFSYYYLYEDEDSSYYISYYDSTDTEIDCPGEEYNIVEIQEAYDEISEDMDDYYSDSIGGSDKFFIILNITKIENDHVYAKYVFGKKCEISQEFPEYYWGMDLGLCAGAGNGDAASKLTTYKNKPYPPYSGSWSSYTHWINVEESELIQPTDVPTSTHSFGDKLLFEYTTSTNYVCVNSDQFELRLSHLSTIANDPYYKPTNKEIASYEVLWDITPSGNPHYICHKLRIDYGNQVIGTMQPPQH